MQEVLADAALAGVPLHIVHLNSMALGKTREALQMIERARSAGLDVTTEAYPYIAGSAFLESALFDPGWQQRLQADYANILWLPTGERLTAESFARYRKQGGRVVIFGNTEEMVRVALTHPLVMIASDGRITHGEGHPRSAGTYARLIGKYVREERALTLMEAIRKSSLMPAQRLEAMAPSMRQKGRLTVGTDADIAVFDPQEVLDKATFENPAQFSQGFRFVLVQGTLVVRDGQLEEGIAPGQPIRAQ